MLNVSSGFGQKQKVAKSAKQEGRGSGLACAPLFAVFAAFCPNVGPSADASGSLALRRSRLFLQAKPGRKPSRCRHGSEAANNTLTPIGRICQGGVEKCPNAAHAPNPSHDAGRLRASQRSSYVSSWQRLRLHKRQSRENVRLQMMWHVVCLILIVGSLLNQIDDSWKCDCMPDPADMHRARFALGPWPWDDSPNRVRR